MGSIDLPIQIMPRTRASAASPAAPVRESPRKRKRVEYSEDTTSTAENGLGISSQSAALDEADVKSTKRGRVQAIKSTNVIKGDKSSKRSLSQSESKVEELEQQRKGAPDLGSTRPQAGHKLKATPTEAKSKKTIKIEKPEINGVQTLATSKQAISKHEDNGGVVKVVRHRKTKEEKEAEAMPLAARTSSLKMFVGAHVSIAKGLENAVTNSLHIGGNAFALFLKSQRKWDNPALKEENRDAFKHRCNHHKYDQSSHVVPHGSYLVNLASPDKDMSRKSYDAFVDDLHRCEALGIKYYNFHPGSTNKEPLDEAIGRLAGNLNKALAETSTVIPLLENMAGRGSIIGSKFSDLRDIIAGVKPEFRSRIGVCIDTCHAFAAGYDLRSPEAFAETFKDLDDTVGLQYLKAMHINDSKAPFNSHRDLHQNIGVGFLGLRAFHNVMNDPRLQNVPLILETPCDKPDPNNPKKTIDDKNVWAREIKLLESLIGMDPEGDEFKMLEMELSQSGEAERKKMEDSIATREEKARQKIRRQAEKGQKSISSMFGEKAGQRKRSVSSASDSSTVDSDP